MEPLPLRLTPEPSKPMEEMTKEETVAYLLGVSEVINSNDVILAQAENSEGDRSAQE